MIALLRRKNAAPSFISKKEIKNSVPYQKNNNNVDLQQFLIITFEKKTLYKKFVFFSHKSQMSLN